MYWGKQQVAEHRYIHTFNACQYSKKQNHKYGKLPPNLAVIKPWKCLCIDAIKPYAIKTSNSTTIDFMCVTMIDPATSWLKITKIPMVTFTNTKGQTETIFDKNSA